MISISALSKRCGVSRPHILKLLRDAAASGFIAIDPAEPQRITVLAPLAQVLQNFIAWVLAFLAYDVRAALARVEERGSGRETAGQGLR